MQIYLASPDQTTQLGGQLASLLKPGDVIALYGDLGAGKTSLARGLIQALMQEEIEVPSPTFTILQTYETDIAPVFHYDLYRLKTEDELFELGWEDTLSGITLIEWPERAGTLLPECRLNIHFKIETLGRTLNFDPSGTDWQGRINEYSLQVSGN